MFPYLQWPIYSAWTWSTPVIPNFYWNAYSMEQRFKNLCWNVGKMGAYLDEVAEDTNEWSEDVIDEMNRIENKVDEFEDFASEHGYTEILNRISVLEQYTQYTMLVIGDSWSTDRWNVSASGLWCKFVADRLNCNLVNVAISGSGYMSEAGSFMRQFENSKSQIADPTKVKYVFVFGSLNDSASYQESLSNYTTTVDNTLNAIKNWYTKARIIVIGPQQPIDASRPTMLMGTNYLKTRALRLGCAYIDMTWVTVGLTWATNPEYANHPTANGQMYIAGYILSCMFGNGKVVDRDFNFIPDSVTNAEITNANIRIRNNCVTVFVQGKSVGDPRETKGTFRLEHNPNLLINNAIGQILGISTSQNVAYITANLTDGTWTLNDLKAENVFYYNKLLEVIC